jgi:methyltransferase
MHALQLLLYVIAPFLLAETWWSRRNEIRLRARGAVEPHDDVYRVMRVVYPGMFLAMAIEGSVLNARGSRAVAAGLTVFALAKGLKVAAIAALGERWTFRVLVLPGAPLVTRGPYRVMRHPNYVAIAGEIVGAALMLGAPISGLASLIGFGLLLRRRIAVEERALGLRSNAPGRAR